MKALIVIVVGMASACGHGQRDRRDGWRLAKPGPQGLPSAQPPPSSPPPPPLPPGTSGTLQPVTTRIFDYAPDVPPGRNEVDLTVADGDHLRSGDHIGKLQIEFDSAPEDAAYADAIMWASGPAPMTALSTYGYCDNYYSGGTRIIGCYAKILGYTQQPDGDLGIPQLMAGDYQLGINYGSGASRTLKFTVDQ